jgi:TPR repeat protein
MKTLLLSILLFCTQPALADFAKGLGAYLEGDYATAMQEFRPLAEQGHALAQFSLGVMYNNGQGVTKGYKTAVKYFTLAAEQGHAGAQSNLGVMYEKGQGVTQDYKTAVKYYTLAAEQGLALAQSNLGMMYVTGQGVIQDYARAHMWWNIAASQGSEEAMKARDIMAKNMTASQIEKAQTLAGECVAKNYKGC